MPLITKNFQLNALATQFAAALYDHIEATSADGGFMINANGQEIQVNIIGGAKGVRDLVDGYALEALKDNYPQWEAIGIQLMSRCVNGNELTDTGRKIWQSMVDDMGSTVAEAK